MEIVVLSYIKRPRKPHPQEQRHLTQSVVRARRHTYIHKSWGSRLYQSGILRHKWRKCSCVFYIELLTNNSKTLKEFQQITHGFNKFWAKFLQRKIEKTYSFNERYSKSSVHKSSPYVVANIPPRAVYCFYNSYLEYGNIRSSQQNAMQIHHEFPTRHKELPLDGERTSSNTVYLRILFGRAKSLERKAIS